MGKNSEKYMFLTIYMCSVTCGQRIDNSKIMRFHDNPAVLHYVIFAVVFFLRRGRRGSRVWSSEYG